MSKEEEEVDPCSGAAVTAEELCSQALVLGVIQPTLQSIKTQLEKVSEKQIELTDKVAAENEKYAKSEEEFQLEAILDRTRKYHDKLTGLQQEMWILTRRSQTMKLRSAKVQEAKQKEALKRQFEQERENALIAQPAAPGNK